MASGGDPEIILQPNKEKVNFYRLITLLIAGGTEIMRQRFDRIHPHRTLATALARVKSTIKRDGRLSKPQMDLLYPPSGEPAHSENFDITLLFALLRNMCGLAPPPTGWDVLPDDRDKSLVADLARIKYYRNTLHAHNSGRMEVSDDTFEKLWEEISCSLLRILGKRNLFKFFKWKRSIVRYHRQPLDPSQARLLDTLKKWHEADREDFRRLERSVSDLTKRTNELEIWKQENKNKEFADSLKDHQQMATKENVGFSHQIASPQNCVFNFVNYHNYNHNYYLHDKPGQSVLSQSSSGRTSIHSISPAGGSSMYIGQVGPAQRWSYSSLPQDCDRHDNDSFHPRSHSIDGRETSGMRCSTPIGHRPSLSSLPSKPQDLPFALCSRLQSYAYGGVRPKTRPDSPNLPPTQFHRRSSLASHRSGSGNSPSLSSNSSSFITFV